MKKCTKCRYELSKQCFYKLKLGRGGIGSWCKNCYKEYHKLNRQGPRRTSIPHLISKQRSDYNKKYFKEYCKRPNVRIANNLRSRIRRALKNNHKKGSAIRDLGCTIDELKVHLERKFTEGMTWENYGKWHMDHIKPLSKFELTDREQFMEACHHTNIQPLWAKDNLVKSNKII